MKHILLFGMCAILVTSVHAQEQTVTGRVTDKSGTALPGVNVVLKGTASGTITDADGKYSVSVSSQTVLIFSSIGMTTVEQLVGERSVIDVSLAEDTRQLNEVVITGALGLNRQQKELGYATSSVTAKELTQAKAVDIGQSLNGKVSGLNITTTNSGVFQNYKINIRGIRSLTGNNQPMLVVDGAQVPLSTLSQISPEDIQSTDFLKSSAAAALYGPDAVNGVIVLTTKRGKSNQAPTVTVSSVFQATRVAYFPKLQHSFGAGAGEKVDQYGNYEYVPYENQLYGPRFDGTMRDIGKALPDGSIQRGLYSPLYKNDKVKFWDTGSTLQNTISLTGSDYYISIQDAEIKGLMPDDRNRRTTIRVNGDKKYGRFSISYGAAYTAQKSNVVNESGLVNMYGAYSGSIMFAVMQTPDNVPLLSYKDPNNKWSQYSNWYNEFALPPYWIINNLRSLQSSENFIANATLNFDITPWLKATARFNTNIYNSGTQNNQNPLAVDDWTTSGSLKRNSTQYINIKGSVYTDRYRSELTNLDYFLNGKRSLGKDITISFVLGGNYRVNSQRDVAVQGNNLVIPLNNVSVRSGPAILPDYPSNSTILARRASAYGTLNLSYKDWAFVEWTGRNDWDSRLAANNRSFFYPSVSLSLLLSEAISSLKGTFLSFLKVRGAYSKSANVNLNPYQLFPTYSQPAGFPYGSTVGFTSNNIYPSPNLKPETVYSQEYGVDLTVFDKIDFSATYFNQQCNDQILYTSIPMSTGYANGLSNAAAFRNRGVELDLGVAPYRLGKGRISVKLNATYNISKVTSTPGNTPVVIDGADSFIQRGIGSPTVNNVAAVGGPAYQFQLSDYVRDPQGHVVVDQYTGNPSLSTDLVTTGRTLPLWIFGVTPKYEIGGFSISMTWDYKTGNQFYAGLGSDMDFSGISARSASYGRQRFVFPNSVYKGSDGQYHPNTNIQVQDGNYGFWTGSGTNTGIGTNYFASAKAIRLREVNITYNLPLKWLKATKFIKSASVSLVGRNLLLFVPRSNQWGDPEFSYNSQSNASGLSSSYQTPASRLYGGSLTFSF